MRIVKPTWIIAEMTTADPIKLMQHLESMGRVCYQSEGSITPDSYKTFLQNIIKRGHEAVLEHASITAMVVCDRGITHEVVRHRIASYCQESTRYCNYTQNKFSNEVSFVDITEGMKYDKTIVETDRDAIYDEWIRACLDSEEHYFNMIKLGASPQMARSVLNNSTKTQIAITMNIREWRHFFRLRCGKTAHPQMIEIAEEGLIQMHQMFPILFEDVYQEVFND